MNRYMPPGVYPGPAPVVALPAPATTSDPFILLAAELRAMRQDLVRFAQRPSGGDNPFGYPPRPATIYEYGVGHSGPRQVIDDTGAKQLLNIALKEIVPQGYYGMATIHVFVKTERDIPVDERAGSPNSVLIGHLKWQNGDAGGEEDIDLTRGAIIPVGATTSIQLEAEFVEAIQDQPLALVRTVSAEAGVSWETSSDKDAAMSLAGVVLAPNVASSFYPIPLQARSMLALGAPATAYPTLIARFTQTNIVGTPVLYEVPDPFRNGAPIRGGANFVHFFNTAAMTNVYPTFDLY